VHPKPCHFGSLKHPLFLDMRASRPERHVINVVTCVLTVRHAKASHSCLSLSILAACVYPGLVLRFIPLTWALTTSTCKSFGILAACAASIIAHLNRSKQTILAVAYVPRRLAACALTLTQSTIISANFTCEVWILITCLAAFKLKQASLRGDSDGSRNLQASDPLCKRV
jgi:hypothetical protein